MYIIKNIFLCILSVFVLFSIGELATADESPKVQRAFAIYKTLTGRQLNPSVGEYQQVKLLGEAESYRAVAELAMTDPGFYHVRVLSWAMPIFTSDTAHYGELNDTIATLIGSVRDNKDARELLTSDYLYSPGARIGIAPSVRNNRAYQTLEQRKRHYFDLLKLQTPQWDLQEYKESAGILTTRAWAQRNYIATNRVAVKNTMQSFLCTPIEQWKTPNLNPFRIRRDVDRAPAGDASAFQNDCRTCHAAMDAFGGAFAKLQFTDETFFERRNIVTNLNRNGDVYPEGYVTTDNTWFNLLTNGKNRSLDWPSFDSGVGVNDFGQLLAQSGAFARCMAKRVYKTLCAESGWPAVQDELTQKFTSDSYTLRNQFIRTALHNSCR